MKKWFALSAVLCVGAAAGAQRPASSDEPLALVNANVVNVRDGRVTANATIVLRGGRIESMGTSAAPPGVRAIDLKGKYVLPGLIDADANDLQPGRMPFLVEWLQFD